MKNIIAIVSLLLCGSTLFAQYIITKKDGTDIQAKVTEVSDSQIVFKKFSNPDGPSYKMDVADILMITYENGEREMYNVETAKSDIPSGVMTYNSWSGKISVGGDHRWHNWRGWSCAFWLWCRVYAWLGPWRRWKTPAAVRQGLQCRKVDGYYRRSCYDWRLSD